VKYNVQRFFVYFLIFFLVADFLPSSGEHTFGSIAIIFTPNGVLRRGLISLRGRIAKIQDFPPINLQKHFWTFDENGHYKIFISK